MGFCRISETLLHPAPAIENVSPEPSKGLCSPCMVQTHIRGIKLHNLHLPREGERERNRERERERKEREREREIER